jgi:hypothetical protein
MRIASVGLALLFTTCLLPAPSRGDESFNDLLVRVPDSANALITLDLKGIKNSPIGKQENWASKHESEYLAGTTGLCPDVSRLVLAAELDPGTLQNRWEICIAAKSNEVSMQKLAKAHSGSLDKVNGQTAVFTARNAAFVELDSKTIGMMRPANRQALARWLRVSQNSAKPVISSYLLAAAAKAKDSSQLVMALDMTDVLDEEGVAHRLKESKTLGPDKGDVSEETKLLASLKGLTFTVDFAQTINGQLRLDFGQPVKPIKFIAKRLVLEALDHVGARIDDLSDWYTAAEDTNITMRGKVSLKGLRQILSLITPPADAIETAKEDGLGEAGPDAKVLASQRYYAAITSFLGDLRDQKAKNFENLALWYDKYSHKIDNLPILDVDQNLLKYGSDTSNLLRAIAQSARGVPIQQGVLKQYETHIEGGGYTPYGYGYGSPYGYGYGTAWGYQYLDVNNFAQIRNLQKNVNSSEYEARMQAWRMIDEQTAAIRKAMVQKYKVDFKTGGAQLKTDRSDK